MASADSTPTPSTGLSLGQLADRADELALYAERKGQYGASQAMGAIAVQLRSMASEVAPGEEDKRIALVAQLERLARSVGRRL